jgi:hypothetical protein
MRRARLLAVGLLLVAALAPAFAAGAWSEPAIEAWYSRLPWLVGSNYIPRDAINALEMWQQETFDPAQIDLELSHAEALGMNTMRVFLHDLLWAQDPEGFKTRIDRFLSIAASHGIRPMFVLFDSCWDPEPRLGPQHPPVPGVHNSGWVQGPGLAVADRSQWPRLEAYVKGVVGAFANDDRVLAWDVWNEPDNRNPDRYPHELRDKLKYVTELLPRVFEWAREAAPSQPLTSGIMDVPWILGPFSPVHKIQLAGSDFVSFHDYDGALSFRLAVARLKMLHRPIVCTEYMARPMGSTFQAILPVAKELRVGAINWGFFAGKTQTYLPWDSWKHPYHAEPRLWFHDIFRSDGTPYREKEAQLISALTR